MEGEDKNKTKQNNESVTKLPRVFSAIFDQCLDNSVAPPLSRFRLHAWQRPVASFVDCLER